MVWFGLLAAGAAAVAAVGADTPLWQTGRTESGAPLAIALGDDAKPLLRFECTPEDVIATVYGATHLIDPESDQAIGDAPGSEIKGSAAQMALITDTVSAHWRWAEAVPNPKEGWDMTIRLPFDHPGLRAFPRAQMIGLVFPGGGTVSAVEKGDRKRLAEFVRLCRGE